MAPHINAHRGQSLTHPENTLPALLEAVRLGADGIEFDVQPTADGSIVLMHDRTPMRTTDIRQRLRGKVGLPVHALTLTEIAALDAGRWKSPTFIGTPVPTLRDVVHALRDVDVRWSVELKAAPVDPHWYVRTVLDHLGGRGGVTLMSFDRTLAQTALPWHHDVGLVSTKRPSLTDLRTFDEFHIDARRIDRRLVDAVHAEGGSITAWTVDDQRTADRMAAHGVDAITTNDVSSAQLVAA